ncbi:DgyrCDS13223 [Dimorphilus gyrociliatus]|uniref:DgyrCDS13223 n=1 Tax=Dimorphilus gyrociliatus TaxID=2664684 RepID=A0A7I8WA13_9ANNE|nr:DgyrCDS13223 [Dimorphilus gyrociliatus]
MFVGYLLLPLFCLQLSYVAEGLRTVYMYKNNCRDPNSYTENPGVIHVIDSIKLELVEQIPNEMIACYSILQAHQNQTHSKRHLRMYFEKVRIDDRTQTNDGVEIYAGFSKQKRLTKSHYGVYGNYDRIGRKWKGSEDVLMEYASFPSSDLALFFQGKITSEFTGFIAIVTAFSIPNYEVKMCQEGEFLCRLSGICISRNLLCDGYMHCGLEDNSNNENCDTSDIPGRKQYQKTYRSIDIGLVLGCIVAIFILLVAVLWLGIVCIQRSKLTNSNSSRRENSQNTQVERASIAENVLVTPAIIAPFWEPPPLYQEEIDASSVRNSSTFELPPPYQQHSRREAEDCLDLVSNDVLAEEYANIHNNRLVPNDSDTEETEVDDDKDDDVAPRV